MSKIRIGLVGLGKIARDQHLPVIDQSKDFELAAIASHDGALAGVPCFSSLDALLRADIERYARLHRPAQLRRSAPSEPANTYYWRNLRPPT